MRQINNQHSDMNIVHVPIPYDQLQLFRDEDRYQSYLVQTLIYSTKATLHTNNHKTKCILVITKNTLWLEEEHKKKNKKQTPLKVIQEIVKAEEHPELVIITDDQHDNLRISTASDQRALNLISAIAFYFTYLATPKKAIKVCTIKQNTLLFFQRTVKEKKNGPQLNLDRYQKTLVSYIQTKDSPDIFGKLIINKMILTKQLYSDGPYLIHLAEINDKEQYLCHTLNKSPELIKKLTKHKNIDRVQKLEYAKKLEYKVQLFFEFKPALRQKVLKLTFLFEQLYVLYDIVKMHDPQGFIDPDMLLKSQSSQQLFLREFRYPQLLINHEYNAFIYRKVQKQYNEEDYIMNKMYNIGMVMYQHLFGRPPFQHQDPELTVYLKNNLKSVPFPKSLHTGYSKKVQMFIQNCILGNFRILQDIRDDPWVQLNKITI